VKNKEKTIDVQQASPDAIKFSQQMGREAGARALPGRGATERYCKKTPQPMRQRHTPAFRLTNGGRVQGVEGGWFMILLKRKKGEELRSAGVSLGDSDQTHFPSQEYIRELFQWPVHLGGAMEGEKKGVIGGKCLRFRRESQRFGRLPRKGRESQLSCTDTSVTRRSLLLEEAHACR